ncbi:MAG TPA: OsmC family protein [Noviherbaspirillum sp.]|nr:OsmC family protein [Noviherbaspirillum sp.]
MKRTASASWSGGLKDGKGKLSTHSGALDNLPYDFADRFESGPGTNPEELIGAAHAGCFTMFLAGKLAEAGMKAEQLQTTATVSLDKVDGGFSITAVHLDLTARVTGGDRAAFENAVKLSKEGCPVSKVLNAAITVDMRLES